MSKMGRMRTALGFLDEIVQNKDWYMLSWAIALLLLIMVTL